MGSRRLLPPGHVTAYLDPPSLEEIVALEKTQWLQTHICWLLLRQGTGTPYKSETTWEEATRWIWEAFEPPVRPDVRLVSVQENTMIHWS
jgi:hypothetical protein